MIKILIVDDHVETLRAMSKLLSLHGYQVIAADGYQAAIEAAMSERFDLLLTDVGLWDGDGHNLFGHIRALPNFSELIAIAVTGRGMPEDVQDSRDAGFKAHLLKPVHYQQLTKVIEKALSARPVLCSRPYGTILNSSHSFPNSPIPTNATFGRFAALCDLKDGVSGL